MKIDLNKILTEYEDDVVSPEEAEAEKVAWESEVMWDARRWQLGDEDDRRYEIELAWEGHKDLIPPMGVFGCGGPAFCKKCALRLI